MNEDAIRDGQRRSEDHITRRVTEEQVALERRMLVLCTHKLVALGLGEYSLSRLSCMTTDQLSNAVDGIATKLVTRILGERINVGTCRCGRTYDVMAMYPQASLDMETLGEPSTVGMPHQESDDE